MRYRDSWVQSSKPMGVRTSIRFDSDVCGKEVTHSTTNQEEKKEVWKALHQLLKKENIIAFNCLRNSQRSILKKTMDHEIIGVIKRKWFSLRGTKIWSNERLTRWNLKDDERGIFFKEIMKGYVRKEKERKEESKRRLKVKKRYLRWKEMTIVGGRNELENVKQMKGGGKKNRDTRKRGTEI